MGVADTSKFKLAVAYLLLGCNTLSNCSRNNCGFLSSNSAVDMAFSMVEAIETSRQPKEARKL